MDTDLIDSTATALVHDSPHALLGDMASRTSSESSTKDAGISIQEKKIDDIQGVPLDEPPNGGLLAWLQVSATFMMFLNTW